MCINILQKSLIHFSVYFCAFLVRIDLHPLPLRSRVPLKSAKGSGGANLVHSKAVRNRLVAIILSILKCMFYSRTISPSLTGGGRSRLGPL